MCNVCNTGSRQNTCNPCCCCNSCGNWLNVLFGNTQYVCREACGNIRCGNTTANASDSYTSDYGCYSASNASNCGCGFNTVAQANTNAYGCGCGFNTVAQANTNAYGCGCGFNTVAQGKTNAHGCGCCRCRHNCNN